MSTRVRLAALVVRDGRLLLVREGAEWALPGGDLPPGQDDIPREMDLILERHGLAAPAIEGDFLETHYFREAEGPSVLNLYAPSDWQGEPKAPAGLEAAWFTPEELSGLVMHGGVRAAVLRTFGLDAAGDSAEEALRDFARDLHGTTADREPPLASSPVDALDVLRTLSGQPVEEAVTGLRDRYGEFAGDVLGALDLAWTGPSLDRKTRSLLVVSMVAALGGRNGALRAHIEGALNHGATREDLVELVRMVAAYAGFPAAIEAWPVIDAALERRGMGRPE